MTTSENQQIQQKHSSLEAFHFGDPVPVLDGLSRIMDYWHCFFNGRYYELPVNIEGLTKSFNANVHHQSAIRVKRNIVTSSYKTHPLLSRQELSRFVMDFLVFGNAYMEARYDRVGRVIELKTSPAQYTRRKKNNLYCFISPEYSHEHDFKAGSLFHLMDSDIAQEYYGVPEYLAALNSAWLNESATLFRRKYYLNGSHAGFILYMTDPAQEEGDITAIRTALKESKGPGNFRNLFMYAPNGKKDGVQIIPIADVSAKDEFFNIKNITRDDVLAAHRVPPQIMGIIPHNTGGFGSVEAASKVFARNELIPLQTRLSELNDWLGTKIIHFEPYMIDVNDASITNNNPSR